MSKVQLSKFLTKKQIVDRSRKRRKIIDWFWSESILKIGVIVSLVFFIFTFLSLKFQLIEVFLNSLEPLGVLLAVVIFIKETPDRKKQFNYQALSTIDRASGIRNSKARIIALQDLVDQAINLDELDLNDANLEGIELNGIEIKNGNFKNSNLKKAEMHLANLQKSNFEFADAAGLKINYGNLSFCNFKKSNLNNSDLSESNLMFSNFEGAKLSGAKFINSKLKGVKFKDAFMSGVNFTGAEVDIKELKKGVLTNAIMPDGSIHD